MINSLSIKHKNMITDQNFSYRKEIYKKLPKEKKVKNNQLELDIIKPTRN